MAPTFKAAYLGSSNGDAPEFYDLFVAAMGEIGIRDCRMIPSEPQPEDRSFLEEADLIIVQTEDALLIANRHQADAIKKLADKLPPELL